MPQNPSPPIHIQLMNFNFLPPKKHPHLTHPPSLKSLNSSPPAHPFQESETSPPSRYPISPASPRNLEEESHGRRIFPKKSSSTVRARVLLATEETITLCRSCPKRICPSIRLHKHDYSMELRASLLVERRLT